jgi:hypothetical protein
MRKAVLLSLFLLAGAVPAAAQLGVPPLGGAVGDVLGPLDRQLDRALDPLQDTLGQVAGRATRLADARAARLGALVRRNRDTIELDAAGAPARRGELLLLDPEEADIAAAGAAGFAVIGRERLDTLGIGVVRLAVPPRLPLARAQAALAKLLPGATVSADTLHLPSGRGAAGRVAGARPAGAAAPIDAEVGLIDGAPGAAVATSAVRGFARGAPRPSNHGSATASLLGQAGVRRIAVADVYGADPAGGNALAIGRAIDWLVGRGTKVISISLVGPANPVLGRAIAAARQRGTVFVAAVGNDGPAAPPAYPASYPGVIAVTGVDGRNRPLIEAGRAAHLDYAAPGADMTAANSAGRWVAVRGTSYAAPLVATRAAAALARGDAVIASLDREAVDLGRKGADAAYGRGLVCGTCRRGR